MQALVYLGPQDKALQDRPRPGLVAPTEGRVLFETRGTFPGVITDEPRGENGFGYDPYFFLPSLGQTAAELAPAQKNALSHRGKALRQLCARLPVLLRD